MNTKNFIKAFAGSAILLFSKAGVTPVVNNTESVNTCYVDEVENLKTLNDIYKEKYAKIGVTFDASYIDYDIDIVEPVNGAVPNGYILTYDDTLERNIGYREEGPATKVSIDENGNVKIEEYQGPVPIGTVSDYYLCELDNGEKGNIIVTEEEVAKLTRTK